MSTPRRGLVLLCAALLAGSLSAQEPPALPALTQPGSPEPPPGPPEPPPGGWPRIDVIIGPRPFTAPVPDPTTLWVDADFLLGWAQSTAAPIPLLTTGPATRTSAGVLGNSGVRPVNDGSGLGDGVRAGASLRAGAWFSEDTTIGAEARFFFLGPLANDFAVNSPGSPVLARPFLDATNNRAPAAALIAFSAPGNPLQQSGGFAFQYHSRFWGTDGGLVFNLARTDGLSLDLLPAFRFLQLREEFRLEETTRYAPRSGTRLDGSTLGAIDSFKTHTEFYGGTAGLRVGYRLGAFSAVLTGQLGAGPTNLTSVITGGTGTLSPRGVVTFASGGLFALPSNIVASRRDLFAFVPEANLRLGYEILPNLELTFGYMVLDWSDVARAARQIEPGINFRQAPSFPTTVTQRGAALPLGKDIRRSDYWVQALSWGVEWRY